MNFNKYIIGVSFITGILMSCSNSNGKADGYGNFEATEITISAENNGKLMHFNVNEGDILKKVWLFSFQPLFRSIMSQSKFE